MKHDLETLRKILVLEGKEAAIEELNLIERELREKKKFYENTSHISPEDSAVYTFIKEILGGA